MIGKKCPNIESGQFGDSNMPESSGMPHTFSVDYGWQGPDKQPGQAMSRQARPCQDRPLPTLKRVAIISSHAHVHSRPASSRSGPARLPDQARANRIQDSRNSTAARKRHEHVTISRRYSR